MPHSGKDAANTVSRETLNSEPAAWHVKDICYFCFWLIPVPPALWGPYGFNTMNSIWPRAQNWKMKPKETTSGHTVLMMPLEHPSLLCLKPFTLDLLVT